MATRQVEPHLISWLLNRASSFRLAVILVIVVCDIHGDLNLRPPEQLPNGF